ncbi:MAG: preprotein translocase subunit SecA [Bacteroidetes bacterium CG02_land_8_20_14_3_00_31_25]|nr:preprotein translocase subunit SecA [Bacteroidota bacterium]PIV58689.1 MAG: preprotein translocase subunit SecA [Bacteroidetes bacterium CG02_land_8_20_14_3_00_31_25]PIX32529.1 MAG: preprotein translocase subunit SecA [Bacteroidetes bacterium CG_4_8_14_3_um_filter_31_14]PIY03481.1 MAG: preprotein translocase subunit SecA [Bacteroidetes bacterium CG_4_10_14_3_um_filter_31_20]
MASFNDLLKKFFGTKSDKDIKIIFPVVEQVKLVYDTLQSLSHDQLREKTNALKEKIQNYYKHEEQQITELKEKVEDDEVNIDEKEKLYIQIDKLKKEVNNKIEEVLLEVLPEAFAIVKDTARRFIENERIEVTATEHDRNLAAQRSSIIIEGSKAIWLNTWLAGGNEITWDMVHYDVQLIGGMVLHQGKIAEMATGEGKTLVATLPVFLNALAGKGVHIVTVNDYLARRDSEWMGPIYEFHGLTVDCIDKHQPNSVARRNAYLADVTFGTNNEFGFDYLRDNMAINAGDLVQRGHYYAIVDEVDSVLIDDARTPLIISGPTPKGDDQLFNEYKPKVEKLANAQKNIVNDFLNQAKKLIQAGDNEKGGVLLLKAYKGLPKNKALIKFLSEQGIKTLMHKTENVYLQDNSKRMPEITEELFFVIDEKNNQVELMEKGIDLITNTTDDPHMFVMPDIGGSIAEIEKSGLDADKKLVAKDELIRDYSIKTERVHTINQLLKAYAMFEKDVEYVVMNNAVKIVDEQTGRILEGRRYSDGLHQAIEAKEGVKVEAATQTFATITLQNYFRMYHKLAGMTGTAETEAGELWNIYKLDVVVVPTNRPMIRKDMQDKVYKTKREKYNAVIEEIVELINAGRPVLVGTTNVEISELLSRMLKLRGIKHNVLNAKLHQREADIVAEAGKGSIVTIATNMAGRGTDIKLSTEVKAAGGLAIIGTERHESRRVDRQLRGRSGRQGDPGTSQFYVCLEDDLMRLFGSDRIARMMDRLGIKEGEVIQHSMITKSIERAQRKVEENNFGIRKRLLEYDDVMNSQREVIYTRRRNALFGEKISVDISNSIYDVSESIVNQNHGNATFDEFNLELIRYLAIASPISEQEYLSLSPTDITETTYNKVYENYLNKSQLMAKQAYPVIRDVYEKSGHVYENIVVPVSDGTRVFQIITNLKKSTETRGRELLRAFEKTSILITIDEMWKEHLREMDDLKQSVQNAAYEQKDPLLIYKFESFDMFRDMINRANREIVSILTKGHIPIQNPEQVHEAKAPKKLDMSKFETGRPGSIGESQNSQNRQEEQKVQPVRVEKKVGRNDACPCGSGKKYKNCHGINAQ